MVHYGGFTVMLINLSDFLQFDQSYPIRNVLLNYLRYVGDVKLNLMLLLIHFNNSHYHVLQTVSQDSSLASVIAFCSISWANWLSCLNFKDLWQKQIALFSCPLKWQMNPKEKKVWALEEFRLTHCYKKFTAFLYSFSLRQA